MTLLEIADEYDDTYKRIRARERELKTRADAEADERIRRQLLQRYAALHAISRETRELRDVCRDYYRKEAYINAHYTTRYILWPEGRVSALDKGLRRDKRRVIAADTVEAGKGNSGGIDAKAARDAANALLRWPVRGRNRRKARSQQ